MSKLLPTKSRSQSLGRTAKARFPREAAGDSSALAFAQARDGSTPTAALDLGGHWQFRAVGDAEWMNAQVPSTVHTNLLRAGKIEDPFFRDNELKVQWVETREWEYRRDFNVEPALLAHDRVLLECRGLDTIAEVTVNGALVAQTINMWIEHEFDVKPLLRPGANEIRVLFRSPLKWSREQKDSDPKACMICREGDTRLDCTKGLFFVLRKEACSFGWDWAPRMVTCGIWKPIRLAAYQGGRIADLAIRQDLTNPKRAMLAVSARLESFGGRPLRLDLEVRRQGARVASATARVPGAAEVQRTLAIRNPKLWWPLGWGQQPLYTIVATLRDGAHVVHERQLRIGLRMVEIMREKDARGESFGLKVNGRLLFAKGANWVPADALCDRLTEDHYRHLLRSAQDAHMNMLRIWGGGRYEADVFYEYCDEHGILIWHDFMFAVGPYIGNPGYLENVRQEVKNVVRRRRHHPSIALWCGNNESEANMGGVQNWNKNYAVATWEEYDKVFHETIPQTVARHDPDRPYWPSSPHHPLDRERKNPNWETASGDAHDWDVWHGGKPFTWFEQLPQFRFVSEFGFESLPVLETIRAFTAPADRFFSSYVLDHHEKSGVMKRAALATREPNRGAARIARYAASLFPMPSSLAEWVYISQLVQGEGLRLGIEALRRSFPTATGALYWQYGDNWPVISCSSIDYYGRWKAVHYLARRFFNPILLSAEVKNTTVALWGVNDTLAPVSASLEWRLARFDGAEVRRGAVAVTLPANGSSRLLELSFAQEMSEDPAHCTYRNDSFANGGRYYLWFRLLQGRTELSSNAVFFVPHKYLQLADPKLTVRVLPKGGRKVVRVTAERFAAYVELGLRDGYARFSDNFFHLPPGASREVELLDMSPAVANLSRRLSVRSLASIR